MAEKIIRIGTRGSKLAIYQAELTQSLLQEQFPNMKIEIVIIHTKGDKILDVALSKIGDKGLFTKEIELALLKGEIDIAAHSLKDLPTTFPKDLKLGAVLARGEFRDALISKDGKKLSELTEKDVIGTSSLRRKAALLRYNPNFTIVDVRGNVQTRLKKMEEGHCDALLMAAAGFQRLGLDDQISEILEPSQVIPATAQGIIGLEIRDNDSEIEQVIASVNDKATWKVMEAERSFLKNIEGGCQVPVGCFSNVIGEEIELNGFVSTIDGQTFLKAKKTGNKAQAVQLGEALAADLKAQGALEILEQIRKQNG